jgi:predicted nucleic acid-binding protein
MMAPALIRVNDSVQVPDLLFPEAGNAIWKKVRRGELTPEEAQRLVADLSRVAVDTVATRGLVADAYALANATGRSVYDSTYVALAVRLETQLITADDRLKKALAAHPMIAAHATRGILSQAMTCDVGRVERQPRSQVVDS